MYSKKTVSLLVMVVAVILLGAVGTVRTHEKAKPLEIVEIKLSLDKTEAAPGETVRLEQLIAASSKALVTQVSHRATRIGSYDTKANGLVNLRSWEFSISYPAEEFDGLSWITSFPHGMAFTVYNPREKGKEFEFKPKHLGIFLITVSWHLRNRNCDIASNPVVLTVKPPLDKAGKPMIKPEWLETNEAKIIEIIEKP